MNANAPDFERHLLGHCLDENLHFLEASQIVSAEEFSLSSHQTIFRSIGSVIGAGQTADIMTVGQFLMQHKLVQATGGLAYLSSLTEGLLLKRRSITDYAETVRIAAQRRQLVALTERVSREGMLPSSTIEDLLAQTEDGLLYIRSNCLRANSSGITSAILPLMDCIHCEHARETDLLGLPSGINSLDAMTRGLQTGEVTIIGARSGVGKSSLMMQIAIANCAKDAGTHLLDRDGPRTDDTPAFGGDCECSFLPSSRPALVE